MLVAAIGKRAQHLLLNWHISQLIPGSECTAAALWYLLRPPIRRNLAAPGRSTTQVRVLGV